VRRTARSRGPEYRRELLGWRAAVERHRESVFVVDALPPTQLRGGVLERIEVTTAPEFVVVNAVAAFHLSVLFRAARPDVTMADAAPLYGEDKGERKLRAVVGLDLLDRERERASDLGDEIETGPDVEPAVKTEHSQTGAVVQRRVLVRPGSPHLDELDVDLDRFAGGGFLEQLQLPGPTSAFGPLWPGQAEIIADPRDGAGRNLHLMHAPQPQARAAGAPAKLTSCVGDELDHGVWDPAAPALGIAGD